MVSSIASCPMLHICFPSKAYHMHGVVRFCSRFPLPAAGVRFRFCNWCARTFPVVLGWWNQPVAWRPSTTCTTPDRYGLRAPSRVDLSTPSPCPACAESIHSIATPHGFSLLRFASWPCVCVFSVFFFMPQSSDFRYCADLYPLAPISGTLLQQQSKASPNTFCLCSTCRLLCTFGI